MICTSRKGFLTLRDCGTPSTSMCAQCGSPTCVQHLSPASGFTKCLTCAAMGTEEKPEEEGDEINEDTEFDSDWSTSYRNDYYRDTSYSPSYHGHSRTHYDSTDTASFDASANDTDFDEGDEGSGGFGDS